MDLENRQVSHQISSTCSLQPEDYKIFCETLAKEVMASVMDAEGKILFVNDKFIETTKYSHEELLGHTHQILRSGLQSEEFFTKLWEIIRAGQVWHGEIHQKAKDGSAYWVNTFISPIKGANGEPEKYICIHFVITEQKKMESFVQQSQYVRSLIEASLDPLVTISSEGVITDVNEALIKALGVSREKLIGTDFSDYFTEPQKAREGYKLAFAQGSVADYPLTLRHVNGKLTEVLYNASIYKDSQNNVLGVFAAARDVTQLNRTMKNLVEMKNLMDNILQSSIKYSIIVADLDSNILYWNEGARKIYGYTTEEMVGQNSKILWEPGELKNGALHNLLEKAIKNGVAEGEFKRVRKDGSRFTASLVASPRFGQDGKPIGFLFMSHDISEKKRIEEQVSQAAQYARSLIEASLDPLVTISADGKITDVNEASVKATGIPREKLIGTDFSDYFTEPQKAREGYQQVFAKGSVADYPLTIRHIDGHLIEVFYNASIYKDAKGNTLGVFAAARDVTAQKKAERELAGRFAELEKFQKITVGRELRMIELKKEIEELKKELDELKKENEKLLPRT